MEIALNLMDIIGPAIPVAFITGILLQFIKMPLQSKFGMNSWFPMIVNLIGLGLGLASSFLASLMGWIPADPASVILYGIVGAGLAVFGYELISNLWQGVHYDTNVAAMEADIERITPAE